MRRDYSEYPNLYFSSGGQEMSTVETSQWFSSRDRILPIQILSPSALLVHSPAGSGTQAFPLCTDAENGSTANSESIPSMPVGILQQCQESPEFSDHYRGLLICENSFQKEIPCFLITTVFSPARIRDIGQTVLTGKPWPILISCYFQTLSIMPTVKPPHPLSFWATRRGRERKIVGGMFHHWTLYNKGW